MRYFVSSIKHVKKCVFNFKDMLRIMSVKMIFNYYSI